MGGLGSLIETGRYILGDCEHWPDRDQYWDHGLHRGQVEVSTGTIAYSEAR